MSLLLSNVQASGTLAARPAAGTNGAIYFATDLKKLYRDDGTSWNDETPGQPVATLSATPSAPGDFSKPHGLSFTPSRIQISMTSGGGIWEQDPVADAANINLVASEGGVTAKIYVFA